MGRKWHNADDWPASQSRCTLHRDRPYSIKLTLPAPSPLGLGHPRGPPYVMSSGGRGRGRPTKRRLSIDVEPDLRSANARIL